MDLILFLLGVSNIPRDSSFRRSYNFERFLAFRPLRQGNWVVRPTRSTFL